VIRSCLRSTLTKAQIKPYVDETNIKPPAITPDHRRALSLKDPGTVPRSSNENANVHLPKTPSVLKPLADDQKGPLKVFTPALSEKPLSRQDIFIDDEDTTEDTNVFQSENPATTPAPPSKLKPFVDSQSSAPFKVFSRPPTASENPPHTTRSVLQPPRQPFVPVRTSSHSTSIPPVDEPEPEPEPEDYYDESSTTDQSSDIDDTPLAVEDAAVEEEDPSVYDDDEQESYQVPLGGRLGHVNVMTPITERTFEFTSSTRGMRTSSDPHGRLFEAQNPVETAEQLAAELRQDEDKDDDGVRYIEERTGTISLSDAITLASNFVPPNPCNPFDPPILSTLLSLIPADLAFRDLRQQDMNQLEALQKFGKKKDRRASGNTTSSKIGQADDDFMRVDLSGRPYDVVQKLGEGGFGTVFEAIDVLTASQRRKPHGDDDNDLDDSDDEDEQEAPRVALKVVKPRNLWEFHILRRIHLALSTQLRRSIITPETLYAYRDESYLVLELCNQGTLLDIVNKAGAAGITQQGACLDELLVMFFSIELMRFLEGMHRAGFIHGDMKIDNCLLRLEAVPGSASSWSGMYSSTGEGGWSYKGIKMIDFGRTVDTRLFPAGQKFIGDWPADGRDCLELREGRPWTFQTDYFGLAGIIYCMLYGKYIEASSVVLGSSEDGGERLKLSTPFKRYWQVGLWTRLFDLLLNPTLVRPNEQLPLCDEMEALRGEMEAWLTTNCNRASNSLKGLLKKVEVSLLGGKDGRR